MNLHEHFRYPVPDDFPDRKRVVSPGYHFPTLGYESELMIDETTQCIEIFAGDITAQDVVHIIDEKQVWRDLFDSR